MAIAVDPREERGYTLREDRDKPADKQTVFVIRALSEGEYVRLMDGFQEDGVGNHQRIYRSLKVGLSGTREGAPLFDADGRPVPFELDPDDRVSDAYLERLRWSDKSEIATAVLSGSVLSEDDTEKLEPSPTE